MQKSSHATSKMSIILLMMTSLLLATSFDSAASWPAQLIAALQRKSLFTSRVLLLTSHFTLYSSAWNELALWTIVNRGRNFGLKSGGTNTEREWGPWLGCRGERGEEWRDCFPLLIRLWGTEALPAGYGTDEPRPKMVLL